jgi:hypothetical protein
MITLDQKKEILKTLTEANSKLTPVTMDYSIYASQSVAISCLCKSMGLLRDSIMYLNKEIEKEKTTNK